MGEIILKKINVKEMLKYLADWNIRLIFVQNLKHKHYEIRIIPI